MHPDDIAREVVFFFFFEIRRSAGTEEQSVYVYGPAAAFTNHSAAAVGRDVRLWLKCSYIQPDEMLPSRLSHFQQPIGLERAAQAAGGPLGLFCALRE